jgi:hypothetical protein
MRTPALAAGVVMLTACAPAPRSESFFEASPGETQAVLAACAAGRHRGGECDAARAAAARRTTEARMLSYRQAF